jgi:hypothetical protein
VSAFIGVTNGAVRRGIVNLIEQLATDTSPRYLHTRERPRGTLHA